MVKSIVVTGKGTNQKGYLEDGTYEKFLSKINEFSGTYDDFLHAEQNWMLENMRQRPDSDVLDVGCGTGERTTVPFATKGLARKVVGVDFSPRMVEEAKRNTRNMTNVEIREMDALDIDLIYSKFDYVALPFSFLSYLPKDSHVNFLRKARQRLKPDGELLTTAFSEHALPYQIEVYQHIFPKPTSVWADKERTFADSINYGAWRFTKGKLKRRFEAAGMIEPEIRKLSKMGYSVKFVNFRLLDWGGTGAV